MAGRGVPPLLQVQAAIQGMLELYVTTTQVRSWRDSPDESQQKSPDDPDNLGQSGPRPSMPQVWVEGRDDELETYSRVCPVLAGARLNRLYGAFDIELDSKLWKSTKKGRELMREFSAFVLENRINFPVGIGVFPFMRYANLVS